MRARERGVDELTGIGMPWMHGKLIAMFNGADDLVDVGDHQPRIDPLAEQVERQGDDIDIAGALAIAEERAFHPFRACHYCKFGGRHSGASVVVGMYAEGDRLAVADGAAEPLDLIGIDVRARHLDGCGKIKDYL